MMEFLYCRECDQIYPVHEVGWINDPLLEGVEFTEGNDDQREFCRTFHACETLNVVTDYVVKGEKGDPLKTLVFIVVNSEGVAMVVFKKRKSISEPPSYKVYRSKNEVQMVIPRALLMA